MKASDLFVKCLENEGVKYIFGIPGEENIDILDSLLGSRIQFITTRHEQGAAFMADVYGRLTGKAGVCLSTLGPGATNLVTGVADANMDRAPLVAITGQASLDRMHKESHQYMDTVGMFKPITKWNTLVHTADVIPEVVRKAFKLAQMEKPGATHIDFPEDVAKADIQEQPIPLKEKIPVPHPTPETLKIAAKLVSDARYPVILAGNGVLRAHAAAALTNFANKLHIPVATTFMGKGSIPEDSPLSLHAIGLQDTDYISCGFDQSDLIIAIGYDLVEHHPQHWNPQKNKKILHIDTTPGEVDAFYNADLEVIGKISETLNHLSNLIRLKDPENIVCLLRNSVMKEHEIMHANCSFPLKPQKILCEIRQVLCPDDILLSDVGAHKLWVSRVYPVYRPNTCIISNGFASMGIALPGAIAAKLVYPERKVLAITGDGGFLMNSQEIETAVRLGVSFVTLIINDGGYGVIKSKQLNTVGRSAFVDFTNPDFVKYAESFGAKGYRVSSAHELKAVLQDAFTQQCPAVIDCPVDYSGNISLIKRVNKHL
ncbi:MAG: acetolactate synthase large subunit [Candidatus Loosdrechtia sp.]|uniref:acetolactate synthase large subunit n=1 Tax=Candidatus Loosdrechtia sp. TaxID=3101272 RepID=UPI003A65BD3F|nr:MAG: acetolactate synthase large subunit [Candidatus Jettenia sp. AMX2]